MNESAQIRVLLASLRMANERAERWKQRRDAMAAGAWRVEALADEWSGPDSLRHGAWIRERDAADRIRAALKGAS